MPLLLLPLAGIAVLALWMAGAYNGLVRRRNAVKADFAQIDTELKRRYDLIPNLVETAKGYLRHERETLEEVVRARGAAANAATAAAARPGDPAAMKALGAAEGRLGGMLGRLFALAEAYPDLKADSTMLELQQQLAQTENRVAAVRQVYNATVRGYNTAREVFPTVLLAGLFGFQPAALFEIEEPAQREAPKVSFA